MRVSASLFGLLGVTPFLGRAFVPEEGQWGRHKVVILSESLEEPVCIEPQHRRRQDRD
jgi:hypothetical protein